MASFYSEKSLVKKKRRKANGVGRSRAQREQREAERIRREQAERISRERNNAAATISSTFRRYKSNTLLIKMLFMQLNEELNEGIHKNLNYDNIITQFQWYLKLQNIMPGKKKLLACNSSEYAKLFQNLCQHLINVNYFSNNNNNNNNNNNQVLNTFFLLKVALDLLYSNINRNDTSNMETIQILVEVLVATTYDLQLPAQRKLSENNAMFIASFKCMATDGNNSKYIFFSLLERMLVRHNDKNDNTIKKLSNVLKIILDAALNTKYDESENDNSFKNSIIIKKSKVMKLFFIHIYSKPALYEITKKYNKPLSRVYEKKSFFLHVINMIASSSKHQGDDILISLSPKSAKHVLELLNTLHQQFLNDDDYVHLHSTYVKATSVLILRIPINYFYQTINEMPTFYRQSSFDSSNNENTSMDTSIDEEEDYHNSDSDSDDDVNEFNDAWDDAGDSKIVITHIKSQMRKLARSPKRNNHMSNGMKSPNLTNIDSIRKSANTTKFMDSYINSCKFIQDFENITLQGKSNDLNGCTIISNILMRWGTPYIFFRDEMTKSTKNGSKQEDANAMNGVKMTGAPLKDLINHYTWLDKEIISLIYYGQCNRDVASSILALNNMLEGNSSPHTSNNGQTKMDVDDNNSFIDQLYEKIPSKEVRSILMYLLNDDDNDDTIETGKVKPTPPYMKLWHILNTKYELSVLSGNDEIANSVSGLSNALFIFITSLYIIIKNQSDETFYNQQSPFKLSELSSIVLILQSMMSRLAGSSYNSSKVVSPTHTTNLVLYLASLKLFKHLTNRHNNKAWIRNSSSLDSEMLKAVEVDRSIMKEQDEAFKAALAADQSKMDTGVTEALVTDNSKMDTSVIEETVGTASAESNRSQHNGNTVGTSDSNDGMTDRERRAAFYAKKFGKKT